MPETIKPGYYLHFKGKVYLVMAVAKHSETQEDFVVYGNLDQVWIRPLTMFLETVEHNGNIVPRFKFIGSDLSEAEDYIGHLSEDFI